MEVDVYTTMIIRRLIMKNKQGHVLSIGKTGTRCEIKLGSKKTFNPVVKKQNVGETNHAFKPPGCQKKNAEEGTCMEFGPRTARLTAVCYKV
jgi:hypothetical protein